MLNVLQQSRKWQSRNYYSCEYFLPLSNTTSQCRERPRKTWCPPWWTWGPALMRRWSRRCSWSSLRTLSEQFRISWLGFNQILHDQAFSLRLWLCEEYFLLMFHQSCMAQRKTSAVHGFISSSWKIAYDSSQNDHLALPEDASVVDDGAVDDGGGQHGEQRHEHHVERHREGLILHCHAPVLLSTKFQSWYRNRRQFEDSTRSFNTYSDRSPVCKIRLCRIQNVSSPIESLDTIDWSPKISPQGHHGIADAPRG